MNKLVFVLIDGLNGTAANNMRFATRLAVSLRSGTYLAAMPPLSRPAYTTIFSGVDPEMHGITSNDCKKAAPVNNFFRQMQSSGKKCAAAAYFWFYELFNAGNFLLNCHRHIDRKDMPIRNGFFYQNDSYPDAELFANAEILRRTARPDFLLTHCMGVDYAGHLFGGESGEYMKAAQNADQLLARWLPQLLEAGYQIIVTTDHGMDSKGQHENDKAICRECHYWLIGDIWAALPLPAHAREIAGLLHKVMLGNEIF